MKKTVKFLCVILAFVLSAGSFTACGGASKDVLYVLSFKPEYNEIFSEVNEIFLRENPEIKSVDYKTVDTNNYNTVLTSRIQSGYLDVFTSEVTYMMQGNNAYMKPLEIKDYMNDIKDEYLTLGSLYDPATDGEPKLYTLPIEQCANVVFYNKTIFDEYGLTVPTTWNEFIEILNTFKNATEYPVVKDGKALTKIESPIIFGGKSEWPTMTILNGIVADIIGEDFFDGIKNYDTDASIRFNNDAWVDVFNKTQTVGTYAKETIYGLDYAFASTYFSNGNPQSKKMYPMMLDGSWVQSQITADFEVGAFPLPAASTASSKKNVAVKTGASLSVYNASNKSEYAEKYIEIFFRDEIYTKFINYTKTPSVKKTVEQTDTLTKSIFDETKYNFVQAYDSRMPRYFPLVSSSEVTSLMKGLITPVEVANSLQRQVELNKVDWQKYTALSHTK